MNLLVRRGVAYARANWGRWVADCASPFCASALQLFRGQPWLACRECDAVAEIVWPSIPIEDIERLLMMRPDETTRNWEPGETLFDLYSENLEHNIVPWDLTALTPGGSAVFQLSADRIRLDRALTPGRTRFEIGD